MFLLRLDMRAPAGGVPAAELYAAAIEMCRVAERHDCLTVVLSEHHGAEDGYLPTPLVFASAIAAATTSLPITVAVVVLPLADPIRLAEEMVVLDVISRGRVTFVAGLGYLRDEYAMFDADFTRRGAVADEALPLLLRARTGEPFERDGRTFQVTPTPHTAGGPVVAWGGGTVAAARRAGRNGIGFFAQTGDPELGTAYSEAARAAGHEPQFCFLPDTSTPTAVFVTDDVERSWDELGAHLMHDVRSYQRWNAGATNLTSVSAATTAEELRAERRSHLVLTVDEAVELVRTGVPLSLHPLIGGLPPEIAWRYFRTVVDEVLPRL